MAKITRASVSPDAARRVGRQLETPRLRVPSSLGWLPLLLVCAGTVGVTASTDLPWRLLGLAGVVLGVYLAGYADGAAHPDADARGQVRRLQSAIFTLLLHRDDGGVERAALRVAQEAPGEPDEAAGQRQRGGGLPGLRSLPDDRVGDDDAGDDEP